MAETVPSLTFPVVPPPPRTAQSARPPRSFAHLRDLALSGRDLSTVDSKTLGLLVRSLKAECDQSISEGVSCEATDRAYQRLRSLHTERLKLDAQSERRSDLLQRLAVAQADLDTLHETIAVQEANMAAEIADQLSDLAARQQAEIDEFSTEWECDPKMRLYNRSSTLLRQLRVQANLLLNQHRYDEMNNVVRQADQLEARETAESRRRLQQDYEDALLKLQRKHTSERQIMQRVHDVKRGQYEAAKAFDLRAAEQRIRNLLTEMENASDAHKLWNLRHRFEFAGLGRRGKGCTGKCAVRVEEFNMLSLPPLMETGRVKREEWTPSVANQEHTGKPPKYIWL
jgi:hypothetical protein